MYLRKNQQSNYHVKKKKRNLERMFLSATKVPNDRSISIRLYLFHKNFRLFRTFNTFFLNPNSISFTFQCRDSQDRSSSETIFPTDDLSSYESSRRSSSSNDVIEAESRSSKQKEGRFIIEKLNEIA